MKRILIVLSLSLLVLTACENKSTTEEIVETSYPIGDYFVSFDLPEDLIVSQSIWDERPTDLLISEYDLSSYEGDSLFNAHQIRLYENQNIEDRKALYADLTDYAPLSIEIDGLSLERILYFSEFGAYGGVSYIMEHDSDVFEFSPGVAAGEEAANSEADLLMIDLIKSFEVL